MVRLDRAMMSFYRMSSNHVSICIGLAAILNAKLLLAISHLRAPNYGIVP